MRIGLIGAGNIARVIAKHTDGYKVCCVYDVDEKLAKEFARKHECEFLRPLEFPKLDLVVEAASQEAIRQYAGNILSKGQSLMVMSVGALVDAVLLERLRKAAERSGARLVIPSGAIAGLDGLRAASVGKIHEVVLTTTKPAESLESKESGVIFDGPAAEAVKKFPKNINVAATLALAGIGFKETRVRIIADPAAKTNKHEIYVRGEFGEMRVQVDNVPSPGNPKTSYLAAMSAVAAIRGFKEPIVIG